MQEYAQKYWSKNQQLFSSERMMLLSCRIYSDHYEKKYRETP